jgi:hypothetical protein
MERAAMRHGWLVVLALSLAGTGAWAEEIIDRVVCVVGEEAILMSELERSARPFLAAAPTGPSARPSAQQRAEVLRVALDRMVDDRLIRQAAAWAQITMGGDDVDEFIRRLGGERGATAEQVYAALGEGRVARGVPRIHEGGAAAAPRAPAPRTWTHQRHRGQPPAGLPARGARGGRRGCGARDARPGRAAPVR